MQLASMIEREGGPAAFSRRLGIPLRTVEDWKSGRRSPPQWLPPILALALRVRGRESQPDG